MIETSELSKISVKYAKTSQNIRQISLNISQDFVPFNLLRDVIDRRPLFDEKVRSVARWRPGLGQRAGLACLRVNRRAIPPQLLILQQRPQKDLLSGLRIVLLPSRSEQLDQPCRGLIRVEGVEDVVRRDAGGGALAAQFLHAELFALVAEFLVEVDANAARNELLLAALHALRREEALVPPVGNDIAEILRRMQPRSQR